MKSSSNIKNQETLNYSKIHLPKLQGEIKSMFDGVENYISDIYQDTNREKPINFTSQLYKKYMRHKEFNDKEGFDRLRKVIQESYKTVRKIKRGLSLKN